MIYWYILIWIVHLQLLKNNHFHSDEEKTMKYVILMTVVFFLVPFTAGAQPSAFLEVQSTSSAPFDQLTLDGGVGYRINEHVQISMFFLLKAKWGELHVGPKFGGKIGPITLTGGVGFGGEQSGEGFMLRMAGNMSATYSDFSLYGAVEFNHSVFEGEDVSVWYDLNAIYTVTSWLKVGLKDRRPCGFGPQIRVSLFKHLELWAAWTPLKSEVWEYQNLLIFGAKGYF